MTKVRVQDATKELSTNAGKMLENVSRLRKQSQDVLGSLRKISADFVREGGVWKIWHWHFQCEKRRFFC